MLLYVFGLVLVVVWNECVVVNDNGLVCDKGIVCWCELNGGCCDFLGLVNML